MVSDKSHNARIASLENYKITLTVPLTATDKKRPRELNDAEGPGGNKQELVRISEDTSDSSDDESSSSSDEEQVPQSAPPDSSSSSDSESSSSSESDTRQQPAPSASDILPLRIMNVRERIRLSKEDRSTYVALLPSHGRRRGL